MIILITGASHTGKTLLAQKLLEKCHFPYLSLDHLKMGLIRGGLTRLTPEDDDKLTDFMWPVVRGIILTAIENRQNLIIEGSYIPFAWQEDFTDRYLHCIRFLALVMSERYIRQHFDDIARYGNVIEKRLDNTIATNSLIANNARYLAALKKRGLPYHLIDTVYDVSPENVPKTSAPYVKRG